MATYTLYEGSTSMVDVFSRTLQGAPFSTNCTVVNTDGTTTSITGTNLVFVGGTFVSGTITSMTRWSADNLRVLDQLYDFNASNNSIAALWNTTSNQAARSYLFSQSDTFNIQSTSGSYINSGSGNDIINGGTGGDVIVFDLQNIGIDNINGGASTLDTLVLNSTAGGAWLDLTYAGPDLWIKEGSAWRALAHVVNFEYVFGTTFADQIYGDAARNVFDGDSGNDTLYGRGGHDELRGGSGADALYGDAGQDFLDGGDGNDILNGGADNDSFTISYSAAVGFDNIDGGSGTADTLYLGNFVEMAWVDLAATGAEVFTKRNGAWQALANIVNIEIVYGSAIEDEMWGNADNNVFEGNGGNDKIDGRAGADVIGGGAGNDILRGGDGADTILGGADLDTVFLGSGFTGVDNVDGGSTGLFDIDTVNCSEFTSKAWVDLAYAGAEVFTIIGTTWKPIANLVEIENITGSSFADDLYGDANINTISGAAGNDLIVGRGGTDNLSGGAGSDTFKFALGDDGSSPIGYDIVFDFAKGAVGVGDKIDFVANLRIGMGSGVGPFPSQADINQTTGVANFDPGMSDIPASGTTLADAVNDVTSILGSQEAGRFAFFRVNKSGSYYMLISDGVAGVTNGDVVIELSGVTSINSISLAGGDLTILT